MVLFWVTGFGLAYQIYGGMALRWVFNMAMFGAVVLFAVILSINYYVPAMAKKA